MRRSALYSAAVALLLSACQPEPQQAPDSETVEAARSALTVASCPSGPAATFLDHPFNSLSGWLDVSALKVFRNGDSLFQTVATSGSPSGYALSVKDALQGAYGANYPQRGAASVDFKFPCPIDRTQGTVTIEWSMKVEKRDNGENNRFMVVLLTNMNGKTDLSTVDTYQEGPYTTSGQEYGVPTYHTRIISDQANAAGGIRLCYGQHIEKTSASATPPSAYIPGFISPYSANGGEGSWNNPNKLKFIRKTTSSIATSWVTYRWVIDPNWQYMYENGVLVRPTNTSQVDPPGSGKTFVGPASAMPAGIQAYYPNYQHFPTLEGVRLYMRNANATSGTWISNIKVTQAQ